MTLLQQIQGEAIESGCDIAALLRRCRILAQRLEVPEFKQWVVWELEGYPEVASLPEYRIVTTPLILGHFHGYGGRQLQNAQIPASSIPSRLRKQLTTLPCMQGVGAIAELLRGKEDSIRVPWPADVLPYVGQGDIYDGFFLMQAIRCLNLSCIRDILDQVQNRVLYFVLELESRNPEAGESIMKSPKLPPDQVRTIFNTVIKGDVQNFAQGSQDFNQYAQHEVVAGNLRSLRDKLVGLGLPELEVAELERAIKEDEKAGGVGTGEKVKAWIGSAAVKVSDGVITVATAAVTEAIKQFFQS